jgi:hypothetical protein
VGFDIFTKLNPVTNKNMIDISKISPELMAKLSPDFHLLLEEQKKIEHQEKIDRIMAILDELDGEEMYACTCDAGRRRSTICREDHNYCNTNNGPIMKGIACNVDIRKIIDIHCLNELLRDVNLRCVLVISDIEDSTNTTAFTTEYHIDELHGYDFDIIKKLCESAYTKYPKIFIGVDNYMSNLLLIKEETSLGILEHAILSRSPIYESTIPQIGICESTEPSDELRCMLDSISSIPVYGCKCYDKQKADVLCSKAHICTNAGPRRYNRGVYEETEPEPIITLTEIDNKLMVEGIKCTLVISNHESLYRISYILGVRVRGFEWDEVRDMKKPSKFGGEFSQFVPLNNIICLTVDMSEVLEMMSGVRK